jgi:hypothetical protein
VNGLKSQRDEMFIVLRFFLESSSVGAKMSLRWSSKSILLISDAINIELLTELSTASLIRA